MKRIVLTYGVIGGVIVAVMMVLTVPFMERIGDMGAVIGYTTMVLAFLMVFFGMRSYRDTVGGGTIGFGRAFGVGLLITLVVCTFYVATWEIIYYNFMPDFMEKYAARIIAEARAAGATEAQIATRTAELAHLGQLYRNPVINVGMTLAEILPVGVVMTLVSAGILARRSARRTDVAARTA